MRPARFLLTIFLILFLLPLGTHAAYWRLHGWSDSWRNADWSSSGLLPKAEDAPEARIVFLAARVGRWRGIFAEHCWIAFKARGEKWSRVDVVGWGRPLRVDVHAPDGRWFGNDPRIFAELRGKEAERLLPRLKAAIHEYPYRGDGGYRVWPGPNSNSFVRHVAAALPEMGIVMPNTAIGRGYRSDGGFLGLTPSGTGVELSLFGWLGVSIGWREGLEIDVLSAVFGLDIRKPALKLPGWGRIGLASD
jgi:hypothetical protein